MKLQREQQGACGRGVGRERKWDIQTQENVKLCWYAVGIWSSGRAKQHTHCFIIFSLNQVKREEKAKKEKRRQWKTLEERFEQREKM